ncbi:MAG: penicillin-binding transpeptidase domain-containing protein [Bacteroidales bacterium]|nr:penicillin-binding transpeptidase domain-containing protein [Bacteroidales bacterium]
MRRLPASISVTEKMNFKILIIGIYAFGLFSCGVNTTRNKSDSELSEIDTITVRQEFKKDFDSCGVDGAIAIYDNQQNKWILSDTIETKQATLAASTFKIINLLIALETKTIVDENEIVKWVGSTDTIKYGHRPEIYKDMNVKEAFELSAGWVFVELAKKIGRENYKKYLSECKYGNLDLSQQDADFWNFGHFAISPINQVIFLRKLYENKLPFSKRNIEIVKQAMITEQNEDYIIRAKTGWTRENNTNTGWWVGSLENKKGTYFFATRLLQDRKLKRNDFGSCRKDITKKVFKGLKVIN